MPVAFGIFRYGAVLTVFDADDFVTVRGFYQSAFGRVGRIVQPVFVDDEMITDDRSVFGAVNIDIDFLFGICPVFVSHPDRKRADRVGIAVLQRFYVFGSIIDGKVVFAVCIDSQGTVIGFDRRCFLAVFVDQAVMQVCTAVDVRALCVAGIGAGIIRADVVSLFGHVQRHLVYRQGWDIVRSLDDDIQDMFADGAELVGYQRFELEGEFFTSGHTVDEFVRFLASPELERIVACFRVDRQNAVIGMNCLDSVGINRRLADHFDCYLDRFFRRFIDNRSVVTGIKRRFDRIDRGVFDIEMIDRIGQVGVLVRIGDECRKIPLDFRPVVLFENVAVILVVVRGFVVAVINAFFLQLDVLAAAIESRGVVCALDGDVDRLRNRSAMTVGNLDLEVFLNRIVTFV